MNKVCFASIVSFKKDESKSDKESKTGHQIKESVQERFKDVLEGLTPEELYRCPNLDTPWYVKSAYFVTGELVYSILLLSEPR
jgi:hypothetical protein